jgi:hypothetical protein
MEPSPLLLGYKIIARSEVAWGQEIAPTIEMASSMIGALAEEFSIPQKRISIHIDMENFRDGTLH